MDDWYAGWNETEKNCAPSWLYVFTRHQKYSATVLIFRNKDFKETILKCLTLKRNIPESLNFKQHSSKTKTKKKSDLPNKDVPKPQRVTTNSFNGYSI